MIKFIKFMFIMGILLGAFAAVTFFYLDSPMGHGKEVRYEVHKGDKLMSISKELADKDLVKHHLFFYYYAKLRLVSNEYRNKKETLHHGMYKLSNDLSATQIMDILFEGKSIPDDFPLTIPEGYNIYDIAELLTEKKIIQKPKEFLDIAYDKKWLRKYDIKGDSLEGYLYPTTYFVLKSEKVDSITHRMIKMHFKKFPVEEYEKKKSQLKLTRHEVLTLASLIEKETGVPEERGLVASVYHNRLKKKMKMECDPTTIYALLRAGKYKGKLSPKDGDMKFKSPYNTYYSPGLPPSPIANPSRESIEAAINPEKSDYIYFVAKDDKSHNFAKTFSEHQKNIQVLRDFHRKKRVSETKGDSKS